MDSFLVITALGEDRPGIINRLAAAVSEAGCNVVDSRMTVLGGEFAIIQMVGGRWDSLAKLETALPGIGEELDLHIHWKRTQDRTRAADLLPYAVEVVAMDHPGIVHQLAQFFSARGINIRDLTTSRYPAAHTGTPMFAVNMLLEIPGSTQIAVMREEFLDFCDQMNLDAVFEPVKH
ncbi:glycine cleavage system protein R [Aquisalimonas sp.]|uniref:glycine cleavage system protein R n=1 Tax=unclassified Aquisalimonas TaxID=2644645 RepID=UPI0025B8178E|nr:glycine cleavage system protein R [Aquisalimonas sp.]